MFFRNGESGGGGQLVAGRRAAAMPLRLRQADLPTSYSSFFHHQQQQQQQHHSAFSMAAYQNHQDELAQLQELSNKWEPEATVRWSPLLSQLSTR